MRTAKYFQNVSPVEFPSRSNHSYPGSAFCHTRRVALVSHFWFHLECTIKKITFVIGFHVLVAAYNLCTNNSSFDQ